MMMTSTSKSLQIAQKLLDSARAWGRDNGYDHGILWIGKGNAWQFIFWDSKHRRELTDLPEKIAKAFVKYAKAIDDYVQHQASEDAAWLAGEQTTIISNPPAMGPSNGKRQPNQKREGGSECDCHGENWSNSPIKSSGAGAQGTGENRSDSQRISK